MKKYLNYAVLFLIAGLVIALDQWTKALVRSNLALNETWLPAPLIWLSPYARIIHWHNAGAAFGMFQGAGTIFAILAVNVAGLIIYFYHRIPSTQWILRILLGFQLGGALGNLVDRLTIGQVTDFISIGNFPVFNVADSSISVGVAILLLFMLPSEQDILSNLKGYFLWSVKNPLELLRMIGRFFRTFCWEVLMTPSKIWGECVKHKATIIQYLQDYLVLFFVAGVFVLLDQWAKTLVRGTIPLGNSWMPCVWLAPFARIINSENSGIVFGLFKNANLLAVVILANVIELIIYFYPRVLPNDRAERFALSLIMAGGIGNVIDRLMYSKVTDFISIAMFPVFNLADVFITCGLIIFLSGMRFKAHKREKLNDDRPVQINQKTGGESAINIGEGAGD